MAKAEVKAYPAIFPVPVALLTVYDDSQRANIITLAWVGNVCTEPPKVSVSIRPSRYTNRLVKKSGEFYLNVPRADDLKKVDYCGTVSGRDHNKFEETGYTPVEGTHVKAPYIAECPVNIECRVEHVIKLGSHDLFITEIVAVLIEEEFFAEGGRRPDYSKIKPLCYCPEKYYALGDELARYGWTKGKLE